MIYPDFPGEGDTIGICAPSAGVGRKLESFDRSLSFLRKKGFRIIETNSVRQDDIRSARAHVRGSEFNQLVADKSIKAVISASGGEYNNEMLPYIDEKLLAENPKWITGASDPTNILYYVTTKLDIATMYGFNAGTFDWEPVHPFQENAVRILKGELIKQNSFEMYQGSRSFDSDEVILDSPVRWRLLRPGKNSLSMAGKTVIPAGSDLLTESDEEFSVTGRLIGGCSDCILNLIGTPFDGTKEFLDRYRDEQIIWYLDDFAMDGPSLLRFLTQMEYCGYLRNAAAIIIGRVMFPGMSSDDDYLMELSQHLSVPVVFNADLGHVKPCFTMINGAHATVTVKDGRGSLEMVLD